MTKSDLVVGHPISEEGEQEPLFYHLFRDLLTKSDPKSFTLAPLTKGEGHVPSGRRGQVAGSGRSGGVGVRVTGQRSGRSDSSRYRRRYGGLFP